MNNVLKTIQTKKLIKCGEKIGVAVSGGIDSMCLLHYLNSIKQNLDCEIIAINVDHSIRSNSKNDSDFVKDYCQNNQINFHTFKVDAVAFTKEHKLSLEEGARVCRYNVFDGLIKKKIVDKIAIAHHKQDQVETILLNIFRGSGLKGASGIEYQNGGYIRPMLDVDKSEILSYASLNEIPFVEDETNLDTNYSRNFLRQQIIPEIKSHWNNFENNMIAFSKICKRDDEYINSTISFDNIIIDDNIVKVPLNMFALNISAIARIVRKSLEHLNALKDMEQKHINLIIALAKESENGTKINLPNKIVVTKEYDYMTFCIKKSKIQTKTQQFLIGKQHLLGFETEIKKVKKINLENTNTLYFDLDKIPASAIWRTKLSGDMFTKFGGGTKKLKDYLIDKKIPTRIRNDLPLLVNGNEVLIIYGVEISDKIKVDENTKKICSIVSKNQKI